VGFVNNNFNKATILIDSGATRSFINESFVTRACLSTSKIQALQVTVASGAHLNKPVNSMCAVSLLFQHHHERNLKLLVADIFDFDDILGRDWLSTHNPTIDWTANSIDFKSTYCETYCSTLDKEPNLEHLEIFEEEQGDSDIEDHMQSERLYSLNIASQHHSAQHEFILHNELLDLAKHENLSIYRMDIANTPLNSKELLDDDDEDDLSSLPTEFEDFKGVFLKQSANTLPEHRPYDLRIDLSPDSTAPFMSMFALSNAESMELGAYLDENLAKGFIVPSTSPAGAPILFVKKKDGTLRMCVDYRGLNKVTIKNRYPLPLINDLLDKMEGATIFSKIDLRAAYNLVQVRSGDEWKTAFRTKRGLFEYRVMPFGLCNAPAVFQGMMDEIFRATNEKFTTGILDDIGIYSTSRELHVAHIRTVLQLLQDNKLYAKLSECEWFKESIELLGHIVGKNGISMCGDKVKAVLDWPTPTNVKELQSFLGLANYYRRFISQFSALTVPLTSLLQKDKPWIWSTHQDKAFQELKRLFLSQPVLSYPKLDRPFILECDASEFALGAILSQIGDDNKLHPISFYSRKFSPAEINYEVYDKELLAIVAALQTWRQYLCGGAHGTTVFTDHRNLLTFMNNSQLTRRQARWSMYLAEYDFDLEFRRGSLQGKADSLSRRKDFEIQPSDDHFLQQFQTILNPSLFKTTYFDPVRLFRLNTVTNINTLADIIGVRDALQNDDLARRVVDDLLQNKGTDKSWAIEHGILTHNHKVYVPESCRNRLLTIHHDSPNAGHKGIKPTTEIISRNYYFPKSATFIRNWIESCHDCICSKTGRHKPYGLLQPLPIAAGPWKSISMDFIVKLPISNGFDSILVVVDRLTKMAHFIACNESMDARELVELVRRHVFRYHGLPDDIVSDRGVTFVSIFWRAYLDSQQVISNLSSAYHPQSDGQTERVNSTLKTYLRLYTTYNQDNWESLLDQAEFAYNNTLHSSTKTTPFFANFGQHPKFLPSSTVHSNSSDPKWNCPNALLEVKRLHNIHNELKTHLQEAADHMQHYANRSRLDMSFSVGDLVFVSSKNTTSTRPSASLDYRNIGPVRIQEVIGNVNYRVELPSTCKRHNVFHVSLLTKCPPNTIPNRIRASPLPIVVENQLEHYVKSILDIKILHKKLVYLVAWEGKAPHENSWLPADDVEDLEALDIFEKNHAARIQTVKANLRAILSKPKKARHPK